MPTRETERPVTGHNNPAGAQDVARIERVARHLAVKGEAEVAMVLAIGDEPRPCSPPQASRRRLLQPRRRKRQRRSLGKRRSCSQSKRRSRSGSAASTILRPARG